MKTSSIEKIQMDFSGADRDGDSIKARRVNHSYVQDPRVGDEFQAEIPQLSGKPGHASHLWGSKITGNNFLIGFPLSLTHLPKDATRSDGKSCIMVNGFGNETWSDTDKESFLLGLYIFEKDFHSVRKFVETKDMGTMLSYYYGDFYGSDEYYRWSEGRKSKSKKCVYGQKIFSGLRQQELLCRIFPILLHDSRHALLQVSKDFNDDKMTLSQYVFCIKSMVGMSALVEIFAIGKGKRDLTRMVSESSKSNQVKTKKLTEIPSGKAWSNLSAAEIIKFIGGDYRLSKGRADDLFWEAIWPRLLARGWHTEQPNDHQGYMQGFKNSLVFLFPGVKKFSRRKLVKGEHYFDSVPDVLNKVANDPKLIELNVKDNVYEKNNEEKDEKDCPSKPVQSYLQPCKPKLYADDITYTIVDTSFCGGKVRELEGLPLALSNLTSLDRTEDSFDDVNDENSEMETIRPKRKLKYIEENGNGKRCCKMNVMKTVSHEPKQPATKIDNGFHFTDSKTEQKERNTKEDAPLQPEEEPIVNSRRQSTRNRPPTAKALEAVANGFLTVERRKRKTKGIGLSGEPTFRPLQRARKGRDPKKFTKIPETSSNGEGQ